MNRQDIVFNLTARTSQFTGPMRGVRQTLDSVGRSAGGVRSTLALVGTGLGALGVAAAGAGAAIVGSSVRAFGEFDAQMTKSLSIMGDITDTMRRDMSDAAREVARTTTFSADEAAEAYFFLASAGLDAAESIGALPQVAAFAQAGAFDLATATDLLTDAQSALGLTVDDTTENMANMNRVSDVLVRANTLANATVRQFSESLTNKAGAALRVLNKDVEEGAAVLAVYADQGLKGAAAGEALSIVLRDLQKASLENAGAFSDLGIEVFNSEGNMRNIADIIRDVEVATDGMSDATRKSTLAQLGFQERSVQNIIALLGTSDAIAEYESSLRSAGGATEEVAGKQLETLTAQMQLLRNRFEDIKLQLGEELAPAFVDLVPQIEVLIDLAASLAVQFGPALADSVEFAIRALEGIIETGIRTIGILNAIPGVDIDINVDEAAGLVEVMSAIRREAVPGATAVAQFVNAIGGLGDRNAISLANVEAVARAMNLSNGEQERALQIMRQIADEQGRRLHPSLETWALDVAYISDQTEDLNEKRRFIERFGGDMEDAADASGMLSDGLEGVGDQSDEAEGPVLDLAGALRVAAFEQRSLTSAALEFASPVFAATNAMDRYKTAAEKVEELNAEGKEGTEEWAKAMLDAAQAGGEAQAALERLGDGNIEAGIALIAEALGISAERAVELLNIAGVLDGMTVTMLFDIQERVTRTTTQDAQRTFLESERETGVTPSSDSGDALDRLDFGGVRGLHAGGTIGRNQMALVGEYGPELIRAGDEPIHVTPASQTVGLSLGGFGAPSNTSIRHGDRTVSISVISPQTQNLAGDIQMAGIVASLQSISEGQAL